MLGLRQNCENAWYTKHEPACAQLLQFRLSRLGATQKSRHDNLTAQGHKCVQKTMLTFYLLLATSLGLQISQDELARFVQLKQYWHDWTLQKSADQNKAATRTLLPKPEAFKKIKAGKTSRTITRASLKSFPAKTLPAALISYIFKISRANATSRAQHGDKKQKNEGFNVILRSNTRTHEIERKRTKRTKTHETNEKRTKSKPNLHEIWFVRSLTQSVFRRISLQTLLQSAPQSLYHGSKPANSRLLLKILLPAFAAKIWFTKCARNERNWTKFICAMQRNACWFTENTKFHGRASFSWTAAAKCPKNAKNCTKYDQKSFLRKLVCGGRAVRFGGFKKPK